MVFISLMWSFDAKFIGVQDDGKISFCLSRSFPYSIDFGFGIEKKHEYQVALKKDCVLRGITIDQVLFYKSYIEELLRASSRITVVSFGINEDYEFSVYGVNDDPAVEPVGEYCLNEVLSQGGPATIRDFES